MQICVSLRSEVSRPSPETLLKTHSLKITHHHIFLFPSVRCRERRCLWWIALLFIWPIGKCAPQKLRLFYFLKSCIQMTPVVLFLCGQLDLKHSPDITKGEKTSETQSQSELLCLCVRSTSIMNTSTGRRRSSCAAGRSVRASRSPLKRSTCWWFICADTLERNRTSALWVSHTHTYS